MTSEAQQFNFVASDLGGRYQVIIDPQGQRGIVIGRLVSFTHSVPHSDQAAPSGSFSLDMGINRTIDIDVRTRHLEFTDYT